MGILKPVMAPQTMNRVAVAKADPDGAIVERIRGGETDLYEILIRRYNQRLYRVARAFLHDDAGVEDVMQEAYLKAFTGLARFQGRSTFSTWLTRILINCALAYLRGRTRRAEVGLDAAAATDAARASDPRREGDRMMAQEQVGRLLEHAIDALPEGYRIVFVMRELEDMNVADTAACLGISAANAKVRLHRAKRTLRDYLLRQMPDIAPYRFSGTRCDRLTMRVMERLREMS